MTSTDHGLTVEEIPRRRRVAPSEHHHIRFTIDSGGITAYPTCTAPEGADCRSWCTCDEETCHCEDPDVRDRGECGRILFISEDNPIDCYSGPDQAPVRHAEIGLIWHGDGYSWRYLDQIVTDHPFNDGGRGLRCCRHELRRNRWSRSGVDACDLGPEWHFSETDGGEGK